MADPPSTHSSRAPPLSDFDTWAERGADGWSGEDVLPYFKRVEELDTWHSGAHTGTFRGNLPAMRACVRAIEYIEEHDLLAHARELGRYIRAPLREADDGNALLGKIRGKGLFIGVEFRDAKSRSRKEIVDEIQTGCYERGVLVWTAGRDGSVLRLLPPLVMTREQAEVGVDLIIDAIDDVTADLTPAN